MHLSFWWVSVLCPSFIMTPSDSLSRWLPIYISTPASRYPRIFLDAATHLTDARLWLLATLAGAYGLVRFVEAYGLWRGRRWAEWFAVVSGGIYIPFELYELFGGATWLSFGALLANISIVGLMINALLREHRVEPVNAV